MTTDLRTFLDIYARPAAGDLVDRDSFEFRYATAALLIACSRSDQYQAPAEAAEIAAILESTFELSKSTLDSLIEMASTVTDEDLGLLTDLVNDHYRDSDKRYLLINLWRVAEADGRVDAFEEAFIKKIASLIEVSDAQVVRCHERALSEPDEQDDEQDEV